MKDVYTIGLAYPFQKVKKVPMNKNDIRLNYVITTKKNKWEFYF